jgi:hypothetical protein
LVFGSKERFYILWPLAVYLLSETAPAWLAGALVMTAPSFALGSDRIFPYSLGDIYASAPFRMDSFPQLAPYSRWLGVVIVT